MAMKRAATSDRRGKVRLIRCCHCTKTFPAEHEATVVMHIQHHLEKNYNQRRHYIEHQRLICKQKWCKQRCGLKFEKPVDLATHHHDHHAQTYWVETNGDKCHVAEENSRKEGNKLISKLCLQDCGADLNWLFFSAPAPNINEQDYGAEIRRRERTPWAPGKDVNQQEFIMALAAFLKQSSGKMEVPVWADLVRTNNRKELAANWVYIRTKVALVKTNNRKELAADWFYIRTASIARHLYMCHTNNGSSPSHWADEKALQVLEHLKLARKDPNGERRLTRQGRRNLDHIVAQIKGRTWTRSSTTRRCAQDADDDSEDYGFVHTETEEAGSNGKDKGFDFVSFEYSESDEKAMDELNVSKAGDELTVEKAVDGMNVGRS